MADAKRSELTGLLEELCRAIGADGGGALYLDDGEGLLQRVADTGAGGVRPPRLLEQLRGDDLDRRTMVMSVPGSRGGVVVLNRRTAGDFTQQDRAVARMFVARLADGATVAVAPLAGSVWARQLEALQRMAARLSRLGSLDDVGATICRGTFEAIDHDEAHLLLVDELGFLRAAAAATADGGMPPPLPYDGPIGEHISRALAGTGPMLAQSLADDRNGRSGAQSMLIVPLLHEARVSGLICLLAHGEGRFDDDDMRLLRILADQAAVAIENARLLLGRDELVHELAGLLDISEAAGAASDERQLATLLAAKMRGATATDGARVSRWEAGSTVLRLLGSDGMVDGEEHVELADSPARWGALRDGRPAIIEVESLDDGGEARQLRALGAQTLILLPLASGGRTIGLVELFAVRQPRRLTEAQLHACDAMARLAATGLERARLVEQLRNAADIDPVTGVHNHRYLQERLRQEVARSARSQSPLAVLMMDLDHFKPINDRHGHADGDRVLHNIGAAIMAQVRASDVVARYGGDEFVLLMPDTSSVQADLVARRVVGAVLGSHHELSDGSRVGVGLSAGLALYPDDGRTTAQLLQAADAAMYAAKRRGGRAIQRSSGQTAVPAASQAAAGAG